MATTVTLSIGRLHHEKPFAAVAVRSMFNDEKPSVNLDVNRHAITIRKHRILSFERVQRPR
jgi:hypothetical protein